MSMHRTLYVGPYIKVDGVSNETIETFESVVTNGQGELTDWNGTVRYLISNRKLPGVSREMWLDEEESPQVISGFDVDFEAAMFRIEADALLNYLIDEQISSQIAWGVVVGVF